MITPPAACHVIVQALIASAALQGAVIRGIVVENYTGHSLARTVVTLQPIAPTPAGVVSVRANYAGAFEFAPLPAGAYIVRAVRQGFLNAEYGQREWNSAGTPVVLADNGQAFLNIRLRRFAGITGVIRDENEVGLAGHDIVAYRVGQPPQLEARGTSDDRGVYRISGLQPGTYMVRTVGHRDDEISWLPTFSKQTTRADDALRVQAYADEDTKDVDVHPLPGKLFNLSGRVAPVPDGYSVQVTLASDMGRRIVESPGFEFRALPPGAYEIYAEVRAPESGPGSGGPRLLGGYTRFNIADRDLNGMVLSTPEVRETLFEISGLPADAAASMPILARRRDLAGAGELKQVMINKARALIPPGRWEMFAHPPPGTYVSQFAPRTNSEKYHPGASNEVTVQYSSFVRITIAGGASAVSGLVKAESKPVAGAPVFLEPWDPDNRKRVAELQSTRSGPDGVFRFESVAPGAYRILSSFEYAAPDSAAMDLAGARDLQVEIRSDLQVALDLHGPQ